MARIKQQPTHGTGISRSLHSKKTRPQPPKGKRWRPKAHALAEIRKYQGSTELLIKKLPFQRLVRQIANEVGRIDGLRFQTATVLALPTATDCLRYLKTLI